MMLVLVAPQMAEARQSQSQKPLRFFEISGGMGISIHSTPSLADYINITARPRQLLDEFSSAVEFFITPELQVSEEWSMGLEYSLLLKSYTLDDRSGFSRSEFSYQVHMPTLLLHYLVIGEGYKVKFGGGVGYHIAKFNQSFLSYGTSDDFTAKSIGVKLEAVGNTKFDDTFYGSIGIDLRWDFLGTLKKPDGSEAFDRTTSTTAKMNFFSAGLKFGVTFRLY
ncbi:MAG: hypothetical protein HY088_00845 [Ignavibacteriales bacterium]|nr:hypothetical protein [Ignavibacteriales bacterium]